MEENNKLSVFQGNTIRKEWHNEQWYFSVVDVIEILTDSPKPTAYWNKVQKTLQAESELYPFWIKLKLVGQDGKARPSDCATTEGILRIAMSVPSPKAEPLKLWLAQVGTERIQETENPELMSERQIALYKAKGYPDEWIERRRKGIEVRKELTDEWKTRGVHESKDFSILTATIAKGTFGLSPSEHSKLKGLEKENLRDHMTTLELLFSSLGEEITRRLAIDENAIGFHENHDVAQKGGQITGNLVKQTEKDGVKVVSSDNYLNALKNNAEGLLPENSVD
jgi:DNA-damage-inducible protein D